MKCAALAVLLLLSGCTIPATHTSVQTLAPRQCPPPHEQQTEKYRAQRNQAWKALEEWKQYAKTLETRLGITHKGDENEPD